MMRTGMVGRAAPRLVHACKIRNRSNDSVDVRVLYEPVHREGDNIHERRVEFRLGKASQTRVEEEAFDMGSYQIREAIRTIEVTRSNGQIQEINAPFDNVNGIELDWLFVIEDRNISSLEPNSQ